MKPITRVSAKKYGKVVRSAQVKWKIKGEKDGPIYQGQRIIQSCKSCPKKKIV